MLSVRSYSVPSLIPSLRRSQESIVTKVGQRALRTEAPKGSVVNFLPPSENLFRISSFVNSSKLFEKVRLKEEAIARLERLTTAPEVKEVAQVLNSPHMRWDHPIFSTSDLLDFTLLAHIMGLIK